MFSRDKSDGWGYLCGSLGILLIKNNIFVPEYGFLIIHIIYTVYVNEKMEG